MSSDATNRMKDMEAPMPYQRRGDKDFKSEEVEYTYWETTTENIVVIKQIETPSPTQTDPDAKVLSQEKSTESRTTRVKKKVYLLAYGHTVEEDCENFFLCFERLQKKLPKVWQEASSAKGKDATRLWEATEEMLIGTANTNWQTIVDKQADPTARTWEAYKNTMGSYIHDKIMTEDAYNVQVRYLFSRIKPRSMKARDWHVRTQTIIRWMPYLFKDMEHVQRHFPNATWKDWWTTAGKLSDSEVRQIGRAHV